MMNNWYQAICGTNQIDIHYTRTGGNKPSMIMLHGLMGDGLCWAPVAKALEDTYDVIMPDARGHGKSSAPNSGYQYEDHAKDIEGLIDALKLSSPVILGHSMGGMTAALLAYRKQHHFRGLILAEPTFLPPALQQEVYESDVAEQHSQFLNKSFDTILTEAKLKQTCRPLETLTRIAKARYQTSIDAFQVLTPPNPAYQQLMKHIHIPSLLITAEKGIISPDIIKELQNLNPKLEIKEMTGVGHGLHYDKPEELISMIKSFLYDCL